MAVNDVTYRALTQAVLSTAQETLYTVPVSSMTLKTVITLACINSASTNFDLWFKPSADSIGDKHLIRPEKNAGAAGLAPGQTEEIETLIHLSASGTILAQATSAPAIAITISPVTMETT